MALSYSFIISILLAILLRAPAAFASSEPLSCEPSDSLNFICGVNSPEDLVSIPDTPWVVASGFSGKQALYLINAESKKVSALYPNKALSLQLNQKLYPDCSSAPEPSAFTAHGLHIRKNTAHSYVLYVVGHGKREAIEVFHLEVQSQTPKISWVGCVLMPEGLEANSVTSLESGEIFVTIPLRAGIEISAIFTLPTTGSVYTWSPGAPGFVPLKGTELRYPNGIEVSKDGTEIYVASSGDSKVYAFSASNPAKRLRESAPLPIVPDNLRWDQNGTLVTAGLQIDDPHCGAVHRNKDFDLNQFASCSRGFMAFALAPEDLDHTLLAKFSRQQYFSNVTIMIRVLNEFWFGSFSGDRIGTSNKSSLVIDG